MDCKTEEERQKRLSELLSYLKKRTLANQDKSATDPSALAGMDMKRKNGHHEQDPQQDVDAAAVLSPKKPKQDTIPRPGVIRSSPRILPTAALPDYHFLTDQDDCACLDIQLRSNVEVRPYQKEACHAIVDEEGMDRVARSGIIILPCGAGKTLTSILVACALQKPVLVVCSTIIAAEQFQKEFLRFTTLMASRMGMFAGSKKWPFNGPSGVLFTTYTMLVESKNRTSDSKRMTQFIDRTQWGLVILDEVHCVPANNYSKAISRIKTRVRLGLTATMLREDEKIGDLDTLVGPTLYHAKWKELADRGYIAKVVCTQVEVPLADDMREEYANMDEQSSGNLLGQAHHAKTLTAILNSHKMSMCERLVQYHEAQGDKVLVYCDHIDALKQYADKLQRPFIYGGTATEDTLQLLQRFMIDPTPPPEDTPWAEVAAYRAKKAKQINTLLLSRIGDTSLDLPAATVLIQVSSHFGSRRQEAQRLGRILRAKKRSDQGFYSRFYTLVTLDTHETGFSEKRRQFLEEDCGYGYRIYQSTGHIEKDLASIVQTDDTS